MRFLVVNNLSSGLGDDSVHDFVRMLARDGDEVVMRFSDGTTPLTDLLADADSFDRVIAAGGDGTVSAVLYQLRGTGIPVLPFPSGTANLLAVNLELPVTAAGLADVARDGIATEFDLGEIEVEARDGLPARTFGFSIIAGAGYDATIMDTARSYKAALGPAAYFMAALANPLPTFAHIQLELDGEPLDMDGISVLFVNFGRIQFDLQVSPENDPRDGLLEVVIANTKMSVGLLPALATMMLDREGETLGRSHRVKINTAREVRVTTDPPLQMQYDGETTDVVTPFVVRTLPRAATLLLPPDSRFTR